MILSGWGMAKMDEAFLAAAPKLKAVFYGAGSIRYFMTDAAWDRGILVTSAYAANAIPTAEFALAQILYALKRGWYLRAGHRARGALPEKDAGARRVWQQGGPDLAGHDRQLRGRAAAAFDVEVLAYTSSEAKAARLGARRCSLDEIFTQCDVVSLHTPWIPETVGMITGAHLASMKQNATFINTARGAVVREEEMIAVLQQRPDLFAVLDVTYPEPPVEGSPLYTLPNVVLTPHIAGSLDNECRRMGRYAVRELGHYLKEEPQDWEITREAAARLA